MYVRNRIVALACSTGLVFSLSACHGPGNQATSGSGGRATTETLDQTQPCFTTTLSAKNCTPEQKVMFMPQSWGNKQLPILFASSNCDLRYSVVLTRGEVTCIYQPVASADHADSSAPASTCSVGARSHVRTVLRDKPVRRTISRTDIKSRKCIRLTLPTMNMVITS